MNEAQLRDELAGRLELLEPGLTLIQMEYPLENPIGAKGFIDILARDRFGNRVIIELKRSNHTARQALHEILKYIALFIGAHGIKSDRIRCFVVSTEWHELLVPFAQLLNDTQFQAEGFRLDAGPDGIISVDRVTLPKLPDPVKPFYHHGIHLFSSDEMRASALARLKSAMYEVGVSASLLLLLDYRGNHTAVIYPYAIYIIPLSVEADELQRIRAEIQREYSDEVLDVDEKDLLVEQYCHLRSNERVADFHDIFDRGYTYECGNPEKFSSMRHFGWDAREVVRLGTLGDAAASDDEVLRLVAGVEGQSDVRFYRTLSPRISTAWKHLQIDSSRCLTGNSAWETGFHWFCGVIERDWPDAVVTMVVYNPMNLPVSLYKIAAYGDPRFVPSMELFAFEERQHQIRFLIGDLLWNGPVKPASVQEVFSDLSDGLEEFMFRSCIGAAEEWDEEIMRKHGLSYEIKYGEVVEGQLKVERISIGEGHSCSVRVDDAKSKPLGIFLWSSENYLKELRAAMDSIQKGL